MRQVLILGATSSIAASLARRFARQGASLYLAGRELPEVERLAADLTIRYGNPTYSGRIEAEDFESHTDFVERAVGTMGGVDGVVFAMGHLGEQPRDSHRAEAARRIAQINFTAAVSLLSPVANLMEKQNRGVILGLSSVAGDRGRRGNYVYGAAKGGFSLYLQGLRNRLDRCGVKVFTLKLGFVDTAMTYGKEGLFLVASPDQVALQAYRIVHRSAGVYYLPPFWRLVMLIIRLIPEGVFKRLNL